MWTPVLTPTLYQHPTSSPCIHIRRTGARIDSFSHSHSGRIRVFILSLADARYPSATMMFCTTFLSTPADELVCEGGVGEVKGGGRSSPVGVVPGQGLGPGGCLSTLHCLVLPQEELCQSLAYRQGDGPCSNSAVGKRMLLEVNRATSFGREDRGGGGCGARKHRSRSVSPALGRRPASPAKDWFKGMVARGTWHYALPSAWAPLGRICGPVGLQCVGSVSEWARVQHPALAPWTVKRKESLEEFFVR